MPDKNNTNEIIVRDIIKFSTKILSQSKKGKDIEFTQDSEANTFLIKSSNAFLIGVILDQDIPADRAWAGPFKIYERLGHLNTKEISAMSQSDLGRMLSKKPAIHRFNNNMAKYICESCKILVDKYKGDASNIWNDQPYANQLQDRLMQFPGIGQKKSAMATAILARDFGIKVKDRSGIDVAYDIHVRRVFLRTGLVEKDSMQEVIDIARKLNPSYPGELDYPSWTIGREWCFPKNPDCINCPLNKTCPKKHINKLVGQATQLRLFNNKKD